MRLLAEAKEKGIVEVTGTRYKLTPQAHITIELNLGTYFDKEVDERRIQESFNFELINEKLPKVELFTPAEMQILDEAQALFLRHISEISETEYRKEMERLGIDLSWKSSQI